jgi:hypothetical protein
VICCYLIERCSLSPTAALQSFAFSREGGINHEEYREELLARYTIAAEIAPIQEFNPAWHSQAPPDEAAQPPSLIAQRNGMPIPIPMPTPAQVSKRCQRVKISSSHNDLEGIAWAPSEILAISEGSEVNSYAADSDEGDV